MPHVLSDLVAAGRIGGFTKASRYPPQELTDDARAAFLRRFWPDDETLSPEEAQRRAQAALNAHMARLAMRSAQARRAKKNHRYGQSSDGGEEVDDATVDFQD